MRLGRSVKSSETTSKSKKSKRYVPTNEELHGLIIMKNAKIETLEQRIETLERTVNEIARRPF